MNKSTKTISVSHEINDLLVSRGTKGQSIDAILRLMLGLVPRRRGIAPKPPKLVEAGIQKYDELRALIPGSLCVIPWIVDKQEVPIVGANNYQNRAALRIAKQNGWTVSTEGTPRGLRVTRIT